ITPDGRRLITSDLVSGFDIYDVQTTASIGSVMYPTGKSVQAIPVIFAHGGNTIIGGSAIGEVRV
ncbi:hypothetical protein GY45DRAFT_1253934, partial [Cubamyces sp. BRFM 1775]